MACIRCSVSSNTVLQGSSYPWVHCLQRSYSVTTTPLRYQQSIHQLRTQNASDHVAEKDELPRSKDPDSFWSDRFPQIHDIKVKATGKNARWQSVQAILTQHHDKCNRQRRVWFTFTSSKPTTEELALGWLKDKKVAAYRQLRDDEEEMFRPGFDSAFEGPREFTVAEKRDAEGRRFWREVVKSGEFTDEEYDKL
ncbi:MAG: hypothetical protein M1835_005703 [Candelina submexicana]|nr:MAG: hypothetical protein M1835_005703 [Candelina submexicana]